MDFELDSLKGVTAVTRSKSLTRLCILLFFHCLTYSSTIQPLSHQNPAKYLFVILKLWLDLSVKTAESNVKTIAAFLFIKNDAKTKVKML